MFRNGRQKLRLLQNIIEEALASVMENFADAWVEVII